ncbi:TipAS antibiotic-recognition domain-containing protein [Cystobacter fuscus]
MAATLKRAQQLLPAPARRSISTVAGSGEPTTLGGHDSTAQRSPEYLQQCRDAQAREQAASLTATDQWAHVDKAQAHQDFQRLYGDLAPLIDHSEPSSPAVQQLIARHYAIAARFYPRRGRPTWALRSSMRRTLP